MKVKRAWLVSCKRNVMKINWKRVWKSFEQWYTKGDHDYSWYAQQKEIEKLVDKQIKSLLENLLDGR